AAKLDTAIAANMVVRSTPLCSTANESAKTLTIVLIMAKVDEQVTRISGARLSRNKATTGISGFCSSSLTSSKASGSSRLRRIQIAKMVRMTLIRKGTRQPQLKSLSSGSIATGMNTSVANTMPSMMPDAVKLAKKDRRYSGACSTDSEAAPG